MSQNLQQIASDPENSVWVFASAGCGKTKILTNRVLRLLLNDTPPNKILCLTYTNAGANEMQERIKKTLLNWTIFSDAKLQNELTEISGKNPSKQQLNKARSLLIKILDSENKIKVQTIHSFCQNLIKSFPFEAGVKPNFELLDDNMAKLLLQEAKNLTILQANENKELAEIISNINQKISGEILNEIITKILDKKEKLIFLQNKLADKADLKKLIYTKLGLLTSDDEENIFNNFCKKIQQFNLAKEAEILLNSNNEKHLELAEKINYFLQNQKIENFNFFKNAFLTEKNEVRKKVIAENEILNSLALEIIEFNDLFNSLKLAKDNHDILNFCYFILENYQKLKQKKAALDYDDLIIQSNLLLENSKDREFIKRQMDSGFDHILIDEAQDTNSRQWNIIKALSEDFFAGIGAKNNNRTIFVVGDEKQSIFSFQGSNINIGREVFSYFKNLLGDKLKEINLNLSYRSCLEILAAVDEVFADKNRQAAISKIKNYQNHQAFRGAGGYVEIWPNLKNDKEKEEKSLDWKIDFLQEKDEKEAQQMAEIIASKIKNWVFEKRIIAAKNRPVNYGDIMILLRRRNHKFAKYLNKALQNFQIPFASIAKIKFSESLVIQDLLALAKFALLKEDDLNLACLLKSPFFMLSEEELMNLCLKKKENNSSLFAEINDLEIKNSLHEIIAKSRQLGCFEFFYYLIYQSNLHKNFIAYFDVKTLEIINGFLEIVANFQENYSRNLQHFLQFVSEIDPEIKLEKLDENVVKISTIHSAKGLQAPIVIVPQCSINLRRNSDKIIYFDFLPIYLSAENKITSLKKAEIAHENFQEELRLLYVAMTRPEDEIYLGGFGMDNCHDSWFEIVKNALPNALKEIDFNEIAIAKKLIKKPSEEIFVKEKLIASSPENKGVQQQLNYAIIKGEILHKIFETFGKNYLEDKNWLKNLTQNLINKEFLINENLKAEILLKSFDFLDSKLFTEIFNGKINCEFEIAFQQKLHRLDLLIEREDEVLIIDYKSDEKLMDENLAKYQKQLETYKNAASQVFVNKKIKTALLLINNLELVFV
jgi:ATP-dependent helicase/nuclease subunit A